MKLPGNEPSSEVLAALRAGRKIEAIKLLREERGIGLAEAKEIVDRFDVSGELSAPKSSAARGVPPGVAEALRRGEKIDAIRLMREHTGMGLAEAKHAVEALQAESAPSRRAPTDGSRLGLWALVTFAAALIVLYLYFRAPDS